jgi:hypothetical protein
MFNLWFSISVDSDIISGFDLGNIHLSYNDISLSSSGKIPDQSCMVFITIVDMLNGVKNLIINEKLREFKLVCADSSFDVLFVKTKTSKYQVIVERKVLCILEKDVIVKEIFNSCSNVYNQYKPKMLEDDPIIEDIESALVSFKNNLGL